MQNQRRRRSGKTHSSLYEKLLISQTTTKSSKLIKVSASAKETYRVDDDKVEDREKLHIYGGQKEECNLFPGRADAK